jgi:hypothetical protein
MTEGSGAHKSAGVSASRRGAGWGQLTRYRSRSARGSDHRGDGSVSHWAVTGLFDRLYRDSGTRVPTLDTDLGRARSILTVVLSGLAAVGGVVVLTLSASMVSGDVLTPSTRRDLVTVASPNDSLGLDDIYNLKAYPFGMVLAAALGLTPGLVINRLKKITDEQTLDLEKSGAQGVTTSNA